MRSVSTLFTLVLLAAALWGQSITASLEGIVHDPSGAVVSGARVTIVNTATNADVKVTSGVDGRFIAPALPPGPYSFTVEAAGFKQFHRAGIHLLVTQAAKVDVPLEVGAVTDSVNVTSEASLLEATTSSMGEVIGARSITDLPLNQRNPFALIFLAPGVHGAVDITFNSDNWSANGGRPGSNDILLDGVPSSPPVANPIQGFSIFPSIDAVEEFKLQTNNYSAEFGRSGGSIVNLIYKSGTNQFHGSMFEFLRNSVMDSENFFSKMRGQPLASYKRNQFGASLGGPVEIPHLYDGHNRTFFFGAYEGLQLRAASPLTNGTVPTDLQKSGDFSQTLNAAGQEIVIYDPTTTTLQSNGTYTRMPFAGNMIPASRIDPVAQKVVQYYPEPTGTGNPITHTSNYNVPGSNPEGENQIDLKVDQIITNNQRLFVRFSERKLDLGLTNYFPQQDLIAQGGNTQNQKSFGGAIDYTLTVSPTFLMNVRAGFSDMHLLYVPRSYGFNPTQLGFPTYLAANSDVLEFPQFAPAGYQVLGNGSFDSRDSSFETYSLLWGGTKVLTHHLLKFGFEMRLMRVNDDETNQPAGSFTFANNMTQGPNASVANSTSGNGLASMLLGLGSGGITRDYQVVSTQSKYYGLYFADDWKIGPRLTLNLGLRYEVEIPRTERYNRGTVFDPNVVSPLGAMVGLPNLMGGLKFLGTNGQSREQFPIDGNNFAPRFGFAYQAATQMVLRGGFGVFYAPSLAQAAGDTAPYGYLASTSYVGSADGVTPTNYLHNPFPTGFATSSGSSQGLLTGIGTAISVPVGASPTPYSMNWNFSIQYQLPGGILVEPSYVGSRGLKLTESVTTDFNLDQLSPSQLALGTQLMKPVPNPFYGVITLGPLTAATVPYGDLLRPFPQYTAVDQLFRIGASSIYHSFQLKVEKRLKNGVSFLTAFTGGKLMDNHSAISNVGNDVFFQNIYDSKNEWSLSANDVSRIFVQSVVWELPFGQSRAIGKGWARPVDWALGGWQLNAILSLQTGLPLTIIAANNSDSGNASERANNNGQSAKLSGSVESRLGEYFNTSVFSIPAPFTFGNVGRTLPDVRAPGVRNLDLSVFKNFKVMEKRTLQLRGEFFNSTNTPQFGGPNEAVGSTAFGQITSQANIPRQVQVALKFLF